MTAQLSVIMPVYNEGATVAAVIETVLKQPEVVELIVVNDASTDGTRDELERVSKSDPRIRLLHHEKNQGKGAAVLHGLELALDEGYTHALTLDSDGQHPTALIPAFMAASHQQPDAMILGLPIFDASAPALSRAAAAAADASLGSARAIT
jgi:glycosyltransferase involved in cell wall biosynthesis